MKIYQFEASNDKEPIRKLLWEYFLWARDNISSEYGVVFSDDDLRNGLEHEVNSPEPFLPPSGRLFLAEVDNEPAGMVGFRKLEEGIAEVKRMYVRPQFRRFGLGRSLMKALLIEAKAMNYSTVRLESSQFMTNAHQLYRSLGFTEREVYEGAESGEVLGDYSIFMELSLEDKN